MNTLRYQNDYCQGEFTLEKFINMAVYEAIYREKDGLIYITDPNHDYPLLMAGNKFIDKRKDIVNQMEENERIIHMRVIKYKNIMKTL